MGFYRSFDTLASRRKAPASGSLQRWSKQLICHRSGDVDERFVDALLLRARESARRCDNSSVELHIAVGDSIVHLGFKWFRVVEDTDMGVENSPCARSSS